MASIMELGVRYDFVPVPAVPEDTTYLTAGPLTIGVEYRVLDDDVVGENYSAEETADAPSVDDRGVSIHVFEGRSGREYLRFDCFDVDPHYHYLHPERGNTVVVFDRNAHGDMLEWTLGALQTRLGAMLEYAGAHDLATRVDLASIAEVAGEAERIARRALAARE